MRPLAHRRVLLVEDDQILSEMYKIRLQSEGYDVHHVSTGKKALEEISHFKPELILLDIMMPEMNGIEVLKYLRNQKETKEIPIFLLTALSQSRDKAVGMEAGADDYIVKSESMPKEVVDKVNEALLLGGIAKR